MRSLLLIPFGVFASITRIAAAEPAPAALADRFGNTVQPFLKTYCFECHGAEKPKGDLDLTTYSSLSRVVADFENWDIVLDKLESKEMPSEKAEKFPSDSLRQEVIEWIRALQKNEAAKNVGDPGPVLARRLSNAEYDYTIRDLTGVDLRPTKEFPVDPANQAGFDNSSESLAMSPTLVKKYFEAARKVADHLILQSEGFAFASHPVVADTDRDKYAVLKIVDFYRRQPTDLADYFSAAWRYQHRAALGKPTTSLAAIAAENKLSAKYLATVTELLTDGRDDAGPLAKLRAMWRELPRPQTAADRDAVQAGAAQMRTYVTTLREKLIPEVKNLSAPPIQAGSQTLVLWKNRQMAANRRNYDTMALQVEGESATDAGKNAAAVLAEGAGAAVAEAPVENARGRRGRNVAAPGEIAAATPGVGSAGRGGRGMPDPNDPARAAAQAANRALDATINRGGKFIAPAVVTTGSSATSMAAARKPNGERDPDLTVPADSTARVQAQAAFARFASVFPDAFYITERARVYRDAADEQKLAGRLLSAGLHSMTGFFRDDGPLYDLVLDESGRRELDQLWKDFEIASSIPERMHTSFVWFERTDSRFMSDEEFDPYRPEDKTVTAQEKIKKLGEIYLAKAQKNQASETVQQAIREHFEITAANMRRVEQGRVAAEPSHLQALQVFAQRAYRRPLTQSERDSLLGFYRESREKNGLSHEDAMRDCITRVLMSPNFCYRIDAFAAE